MNSESKSVLMGTMRIPFLLLPPVCVLLGTMTAVYNGVTIDWLKLALVFVGAMAAHISVNVLNEYFDFRSALDFKTVRTPFSGGSGVLPMHPEKAGLALASGFLWLGVTVGIGVYCITIVGPQILPLGILGVLLVIIYTTHLTRNPLLCLVAPGLGFGPLMVMGTDLVLSGSYSWTAFWASLVPFFLVSNLLLLNQFPDVAADREIGRQNFPICMGRKGAALLYTGFLVATYVSIMVGYLAGVLPLAGFLAFLTLAVAIPTIQGVLGHADDIPKLIPAMAKNVMLNLMTPVLLAVGLFVG